MCTLGLGGFTARLPRRAALEMSCLGLRGFMDAQALMSCLGLRGFMDAQAKALCPCLTLSEIASAQCG